MPFTYADLLEIPEEFDHEIFDGELIINASRTLRHQVLVGRIGFQMFDFVEANRLGIVFAAPVDVVLSNRWGFKPDILFIQHARRSIMNERNISGAPDLVIEVLSDDTRERDEGSKRRAYEEFGVAEYWIVDPDQRVATLHRGSEVRSERAVLTTPLLPGLTIPLADVFAE